MSRDVHSHSIRLRTLRASQVALVVKNPPANSRATGVTGSIPRSERSPGGGHGNPHQYSCLENPIGRGAWQATVHGSHIVGYDWSDLACTQARTLSAWESIRVLQPPLWLRRYPNILTIFLQLSPCHTKFHLLAKLCIYSMPGIVLRAGNTKVKTAALWSLTSAKGDKK